MEVSTLATEPPLYRMLRSDVSTVSLIWRQPCLCSSSSATPWTALGKREYVNDLRALPCASIVSATRASLGARLGNSSEKVAGFQAPRARSCSSASGACSSYASTFTSCRLLATMSALLAATSLSNFSSSARLVAAACSEAAESAASACSAASASADSSASAAGAAASAAEGRASGCSSCSGGGAAAFLRAPPAPPCGTPNSLFSGSSSAASVGSVDTRALDSSSARATSAD